MPHPSWMSGPCHSDAGVFLVKDYSIAFNLTTILSGRKVNTNMKSYIANQMQWLTKFTHSNSQLIYYKFHFDLSATVFTPQFFLSNSSVILQN